MLWSPVPAVFGGKTVQNWGGIEANLEVRAALNRDLEEFGQLYTRRSKQTCR